MADHDEGCDWDCDCTGESIGAADVVGYREACAGDLTGHDEGGEVCDDSIFCRSGDGTSDLCMGHSGCQDVSV